MNPLLQYLRAAVPQGEFYEGDTESTWAPPDVRAARLAAQDWHAELDDGKADRFAPHPYRHDQPRVHEIGARQPYKYGANPSVMEYLARRANNYTLADEGPAGAASWDDFRSGRASRGAPPAVPGTDRDPQGTGTRWFDADIVENDPRLEAMWDRVLSNVGPRRPDIAGNIDHGRYNNSSTMPGGDLHAYLMSAYRNDQSPEMIDSIAGLADVAGMKPPWMRVPRRHRGY